MHSAYAKHQECGARWIYKWAPELRKDKEVVIAPKEGAQDGQRHYEFVSLIMIVATINLAHAYETPIKKEKVIFRNSMLKLQ